ncbi:1-aminocyclopropane-1-carboxylate oxidase homolog 3-like [Capsicum annuum]|uniref:1-aminocyclopropane-1-carboxylate oxidase homolog 3-like n=1 Tax=Capsicum annuum TaxID=4072 RepID=UPI001FB15D22|nr:1-aminocyclopropane-1-carboxylate oxidase homolog 3-like [Capsicum annuum]
MKLGDTLFELLSEAIGLEPNHLKDMGCSEGLMALGHYYPVCPQPELTLGTHKNAENDFLIVLLQDNRGGPTLSVGGVRAPLISNDKFKSVDHRVLANKVGPRVSLACFFMTNFVSRQRRYGPIKDLVSEHNPPKYRETTIKEFTTYFNNKGLNGTYTLLHFRL